MLRQFYVILLLCLCSVHTQDVGLQNPAVAEGTDTTTEAAAASDPATNPDAAVDPATNPDAAVDPATNPDAAVDPATNPDAAVDPATNPDPAADPGTNPDPAADAGTNPDPAADPGTNPDTAADPAANADAAADPAANADAAADPAANTEAAAGPVADPAANAGVAADPAINTDAAADPAINTEAVADPAIFTEAAAADPAADPAIFTEAAAADPPSDPAIFTEAAADPAANEGAAADPAANAEVAADPAINTDAAAGTGTNTATGTDPGTVNSPTDGIAPVVGAAAVNDVGTGPVVAVADSNPDPNQLPAVETGPLPDGTNPGTSGVSTGVATGSGAQTDSQDKKVVSKDPPTVKMGKGTYNVAVGGDVTMECNIITNSDIKDVQWIRNGKVIQTSATAHPSDPLGKTYTVKNAQEENKGYYTCKVHNLHGSDSDLAILEVEPKSTAAARRTVSRNAHRVVGGVGGGGFGPQKDARRRPCADVCGSYMDSCYEQHNCTHYKYCYTRLQNCECTPMRCSPGTIWDSAKKMCGFHYESKCDDDLCKNPAINAYTDGLDCKLYYQCKEDGYSKPVCCPPNMSFDNTSMTCIHDKSCGKEARCMLQPSDVNEHGNKPEDNPNNVCRLRQVKADNTKYYDITSKEFISCGAGTVYKPEICVCDSPTNRNLYPIHTAPTCNPEYFLTFNGSVIKNEAPMNAWMGQEDVGLVKTQENHETNTPEAHYGHFNGRTSNVYMPGFKDKKLKQILIQIRFFTKATKGPVNQVLVSNCKTKIPPANSNEEDILSPSIAIVLDRVKKQIVFIANTDDESGSAVLASPFKPNDWNNVEYMYDGKVLRSTVLVMDPTQKGKTKRLEQVKELKGQINAPHSPLKVGCCTNKDGFAGFIDMFKVYECIPTAR